MKCARIVFVVLAAFASIANAMPTPEQAKKAEPLVLELMGECQAALKSGAKTRTEVAESAMALAEKAESEAAKLLLMKGAYNLYVRAGEFEKAVDTLKRLQVAIPDIPPDNMANIVKASLRGVPSGECGRLAQILDATRGRTYCIIDLSGGPSATSYPVSYVSTAPGGTFNTDEYKTTKLVLRRIEPGKFMMCGKCNVTLTRPYYIGVFEVTQMQYELVMGYNPARNKGGTRPVEGISYNMIRGSSDGTQWPSSSAVDATSFMGRLRARTKLDFDLPTEAQWEYACRAGTTSEYNNGSDKEDDLKSLGRYRDNQSDGRGGHSQHNTTVGSYTPNRWGLYDMYGNVWEWCRDWYGDLSDNLMDPKGSATGDRRVLRGGSWLINARDCSSSFRTGLKPGLHWDYGFRLALPLQGPAVNLLAGSALAVRSVSAKEEARKETDAMKALYCVIDLSGGPSASSYPVLYVPTASAVPEGTFNTDEYKTTKLVLRRIEPGEFIMGEDQKDETHRVKISKPFYIGVFEVTQAQYALVMGNNPSRFKGGMHPVERVSYNMIRGSSDGAQWPLSSAVDSYSFMGRLRACTGLDFDLPTEAQWEFACRAGTKSKYNNGGETEDDLKKVGRCVIRSKQSAVVGSYVPNAWGLYDMHGNMWEWCLDWNGALTFGMDPKGASSGTDRVFRGGGWSNVMASFCTSFFRGRNLPSYKGDNGGFRLALPLSDQ